jgi:mono/diheme cytochrome c family protein
MKLQATVFSAALLIAAPTAFGAVADVYAKNCASCHAKDGTGNTTMGKKGKVKDYTTAEGQKWTDAEGIKAILEGAGKMKGYKDKVSDAEAKELVAYVRAFKK